MIDLDEVAKNPKPRFGDLKMTVAQFFRVNGGTTQLRGVVPDIAFPSIADGDSFGESSYDNALPWTQISPADYRIVGKLGDRVADLQRRHQARVGGRQGLPVLLRDVAEFEAPARGQDAAVPQRSRAPQERAPGSPPSRPARATCWPPLDDGLQAGERKPAADLAAERPARTRWATCC